MSRSGRLWTVLAANLALVVGLVVVGLTAHSIGVYAEAADYLADAAVIGVSLLAIKLARRPPTRGRPQGYPRATRYAALANAGWLLILSLIVAGGAIDRLATGVPRVHGLPVLVVSSIASLVMLGGALLLGGEAKLDGAASEIDRHENLNMRAVLLETGADAAAAAGVAVTGAIILAAGGLFWLDPTVALLIAMVIAYQAARLLLGIGAALRS